ncbi:MAG: hypothetical protein IPN81_11325 [Nitrosomonadales bacterium]|nr:hypothetical protein [Nitrosomonadales bacterium]
MPTQVPGAWRVMGDPATPVLPVYEGEQVQLRLIQGAQEAQHVFAMTDSSWLREPDNHRSGYVSAQPLGISEHFEFNIKVSPRLSPVVDQLYMGSSVDQLWDGMWGIMRSYGREEVSELDSNTRPPSTRKGVAQLFEMRGHPATSPQPKMGNAKYAVCFPDGKADAYSSRLQFDISAVRVCDLTETCDKPGMNGLQYNQRLMLEDPNAIIFVRNDRLPGDFGIDKKELRLNDSNNDSNEEVLKRLRKEVKSGQRRIEPMVLRAPAGACMEVRLRNHLPEFLPDGPVVNGKGNYSSLQRQLYVDDFGWFNYNQFRMSSSIGLSAPMLARNSVQEDGANFGLNGNDPDNNGKMKPLGNLVAACKSDSESKCAATSVWWAGRYEVNENGVQKNLPIEFGALPLVSFGDVIKHPAWCNRCFGDRGPG